MRSFGLTDNIESVGSVSICGNAPTAGIRRKNQWEFWDKSQTRDQDLNGKDLRSVQYVDIQHNGENFESFVAVFEASLRGNEGIDKKKNSDSGENESRVLK